MTAAAPALRRRPAAPYPHPPRLDDDTLALPLAGRAFVPVRRADVRLPGLAIPLGTGQTAGGQAVTLRLDARGRWLELCFAGDPGALRVDVRELLTSLADAAPRRGGAA